MREVRALASKIARHRANILITGESGTGKEMVARLIHARSSRAAAPFVAINCAAIPEGLLESELFGHERGAFTGADAARPGLLEVADGGTCLLDEIGDMPLGLQSKLLRVIEDGQVRRLGQTDSKRVDVRFISATHRDLRGAVEQGEFRRDLYYRLGVIPLHIPPLRERSVDVKELAPYFLARASRGRPMRFGAGVLEKLATQPWPGNVRELENAIERAIALTDGEELRDVDFDFPNPGFDRLSSSPVRVLVEQGVSLREVEEQMIAETLRKNGGNMVEAARSLGISRRTLYRRRAVAPRSDAPES
jgi:transcriptional regulator with PAS, ATPase and Fis domain